MGEMLGGMAAHATVKPSRSSSIVRMMSVASGAPSALKNDGGPAAGAASSGASS